jgi:peptidoglycan/xylan/chitin deacetylase (PgdA/CDA1 family)
MYGALLLDVPRLIKLTVLAGRQTLTVLTFHRVLPKPHPLYPEWSTQKEFQRKIRWLKSCAEIVPLAEGIAQVRSGNATRPLAAITFDDGYRDNLDFALPVLRAENVQSTFFVTTRYIDEGLLFDDLVTRAFTETRCKVFSELRLGLQEQPIESVQQRRKLADEVIEKIKYLAPAERDAIAKDVASQLELEWRTHAMLCTDGVLALRDAGMEIGSHSHDHPISNTVSDAEFMKDTCESLERLIEILGDRPRFYAFPNGAFGKDFDSRHSDMLRQCGFEAAFSTDPGVIHSHSDLFALPRLTPWPTRRLRFMAELLIRRHSR